MCVCVCVCGVYVCLCVCVCVCVLFLTIWAVYVCHVTLWRVRVIAIVTMETQHIRLYVLRSRVSLSANCKYWLLHNNAFMAKWNLPRYSCKIIDILLYAFFCVIPRRLNFLCRRFGTPVPYLQAGRHEDGTECSETSAYKIQPPGKYPEESIQHSEHGESLK